jgi:hypothetical protein
MKMTPAHGYIDPETPPPLPPLGRVPPVQLRQLRRPRMPALRDGGKLTPRPAALQPLKCPQCRRFRHRLPPWASSRGGSGLESERVSGGWFAGRK